MYRHKPLSLYLQLQLQLQLFCDFVNVPASE